MGELKLREPGSEGKKRSIFSRLVDRFNDQTEDEFFLKREREFRSVWEEWVIENGYTRLDSVPDGIQREMKNSPFLQSDTQMFDLIMGQNIEGLNVTSFHFERRIDSFFSKQTNTYDALVCHLEFPLGMGEFVIDRDKESPIKIGIKSRQISNEVKSDVFTISGTPENFMDILLKTEFEEWIRSLEEVKVSYRDGQLFFVRPAPSWLTLRTPYNDQNDTAYVLGRFRRWENELRKWIPDLKQVMM